MRIKRLYNFSKEEAKANGYNADSKTVMVIKAVVISLLYMGLLVGLAFYLNEKYGEDVMAIFLAIFITVTSIIGTIVGILFFVKRNGGQSTCLWFLTEDNKLMYMMYPLIDFYDNLIGDVGTLEQIINESNDVGNGTYYSPMLNAHYVLFQITKVNDLIEGDKSFTLVYDYLNFKNQKMLVGKCFNNYQELIKELYKIK